MYNSIQYEKQNVLTEEDYIWSNIDLIDFFKYFGNSRKSDKLRESFISFTGATYVVRHKLENLPDRKLELKILTIKDIS